MKKFFAYALLFVLLCSQVACAAEFYKKPELEASPYNSYSIAELRYIYKKQMMLDYMKDKIKTKSAQEAYDRIKDDISCALGSDVKYWSSGRLGRLAKSQIEKRRGAIEKQAQDILNYQNSVSDYSWDRVKNTMTDYLIIGLVLLVLIFAVIGFFRLLAKVFRGEANIGDIFLLWLLWRIIFRNDRDD